MYQKTEQSRGISKKITKLKNIIVAEQKKIIIKISLIDQTLFFEM